MHERARRGHGKPCPYNLLMTLPSGTLTIFFSDIEGSTQLLQTLGADYAALLDEHNRILRAAIESHNGHEVRTQGDSFFAVFERAGDAVQAAAQAQRALFEYSNDGHFAQNAVVRVRIGLHTGEPTSFGGDDYSGLDVHRAARIAAAGHGGQTLLSQTTRELVESDLTPAIRLYDLGEHRLKDLARPIRLSQLLLDGLPRDFPTLRTLDALPNNLPSQPTPLLGREKELTRAVEMLRRPDVRLLSLLGPGGTGKTRLSLQVAAELLHEYSNGAWFVDLAPLGDATLLPLTILRTLGVAEVGGQDALQTLIEYSNEKQMLLIFDNFEQILDAAPAVATLLQKCDRLKIIVTSRAPLKIRGEQEFPVPPLALPLRKPPPTLEQMSQFAAVQLFIQRAQNVKPSFDVTAENAPAIAEICVKLDGLPLAIELAAARIKLLSPQALLARLEKSLNILIGGGRDVSQRQQTLRDAIAWSHDLLDEDERLLFRRMGVFVGGATLEAIEKVCNAREDLRFEVLDGVCSLVDKSLLRQTESEDCEPRFWMLETIREYSTEQLESSAEAETLRASHAHYLADFIEEHEFELVGAQAGRCRALFLAELDNYRAAFEWSLCHQPKTALHLVAIYGFFMRFSGFSNSLDQMLKKAMAANQTAIDCGDDGEELSQWRCKILLHQTALMQDQGCYDEALAIANTLWEASSESKHLDFQIDALTIISGYHSRKHQWDLAEKYAQNLLATAEQYLKQGHSTRWQQSDASHHMISALSNLAIIAMDQGHLQRAEEYVDRVLTFSSQHNIPANHDVLSLCGQLAMRQRQWAKASGFLEETVSVYEKSGFEAVALGWATHELAKIALHQDDIGNAEKWARRSIRNLHEDNPTPFFNPTLRLVAWLMAKRDSWAEVATLLAAEEAEREQLGWFYPDDWREQLDEMIPAAREQLGATRFAELWQGGRAMPSGAAFEYSMQAINAR